MAHVQFCVYIGSYCMVSHTINTTLSISKIIIQELKVDNHLYDDTNYIKSYVNTLCYYIGQEITYI